MGEIPKGRRGRALHARYVMGKSPGSKEGVLDARYIMGDTSYRETLGVGARHRMYVMGE